MSFSGSALPPFVNVTQSHRLKHHYVTVVGKVLASSPKSMTLETPEGTNVVVKIKTDPLPFDSFAMVVGMVEEDGSLKQTGNIWDMENIANLSLWKEAIEIQNLRQLQPVFGVEESTG